MSKVRVASPLANCSAAEAAVHHALTWAQQPRWHGPSAANAYRILLAICRLVIEEDEQTVKASMRSMADLAQVRWHEQVMSSAAVLQACGVLGVRHEVVDGHNGVTSWTLWPGQGEVCANPPLGPRFYASSNSRGRPEENLKTSMEVRSGGSEHTLLRPARDEPAAWMDEALGALGLMLHQAVKDNRLHLDTHECVSVTVADCQNFFGLERSVAHRRLQKLVKQGGGFAEAVPGGATRYYMFCGSMLRANADAELAYKRQVERRAAEVDDYAFESSAFYPRSIIRSAVRVLLRQAKEDTSWPREAVGLLEDRGGDEACLARATEAYEQTLATSALRLAYTAKQQIGLCRG